MLLVTTLFWLKVLITIVIVGSMIAVCQPIDECDTAGMDKRSYERMKDDLAKLGKDERDV